MEGVRTTQPTARAIAAEETPDPLVTCFTRNCEVPSLVASQMQREWALLPVLLAVNVLALPKQRKRHSRAKKAWFHLRENGGRL
mmetsp:Transcript_129969/g.193490  ORF Transcript_129969/g.193490 Transcript_129969/m.193490 type:complete len:84 (-) Transcript_129969:559-810(-)|eukprot:2572960-Rhodomonas_salina.2